MGKKGPIWLILGIALLITGLVGSTYNIPGYSNPSCVQYGDAFSCFSIDILVYPFVFEGLFGIVAGFVLISIGSIYVIRSSGKAKTA